MGSVKALSDSVRNSIRSGIIVYDLTTVVEELIFNSLDAAATKVSVYVSVGSCSVKVVDDGFGISRDGLVLLGERYVTSKLHDSVGAVVPSRSYGFRGEALASISDVSLLEILTKTCGKPNGYRKIIKGSKCLYLGINDDTKDVGTTVVVRDLFYNQPVRKKYMQSSPKKVLDSVKKCVYRIALVNPNVSLKVVDTESENVLLHALPSSTLSRLVTGFGIEDSDSLCEVNVTDGALKLSGYVSGPCNGFAIKAFQYVYINSRFVCKGPIHRLINNFSTLIEDMHPFNPSSLSGKGKRHRPETYPAYILNLCCPLSFYDLSFEPSKTNVEFKDWVPILAFIKKAIQQLWSGSGELLSHGDGVFQKDEIWDECENLALVDDGNHEPEPLKCGIKDNQSSHHLASSSLGVLRKEVDDMFNGGRDRVSSKFYMNDPEGERHVSKDFVFDDLPSICPRNVFFSQQTMKLSERSENDLFKSDHKFWLPTDYILEKRFASRERSNRHVENHILSLNWLGEPSELEFGERNQCNRNQSSSDYLGFGSELITNEDSRNTFLRSCISRRNLSVDGAVFESKERFEFPIDSFRSKRRRLYADKSVDIPEVEVREQRFDVFPSTLQLNEAQDAQLFPPGLTHFDLLAGASTKSFSPWKNPLAEEHDFECGSVRQTESFGLGHFLHSGSFVTSNAVFMAKDWDVEHFPDDNNASKESSKFEKRDNYWHFTDGEEMSCKSSYDVMSKKCRQYNCAMSPRSSILDFNSLSDSFRDFSKIFKENKEPSQHAGEEDWLSVNLYSEFHKNNEPYKAQGNQLRYSDWDQNHIQRKQSIRSHSAPPFYRCKRKFVSLNRHLLHEEGKSQVHLFSGVISTETDKLKHQKFWPNCAKEANTMSKPDIVLDKEIQKGQNFEHSRNAVSQDTFAKGFVPEGAGALVECGSKWRDKCQQIAKSSASCIGSQHDILNISSGFLHLAGNSLVPESLHKSCLEDAKVLLQVDKKFVPVVADGTLAVIDQHAADERIRLEELRQKVLSGEAKTVSYLDAEKELILPEVGYQLLHSYAEQTREWGWICNIQTQSSGTFEKNLNVLHQQPKMVTLLAVPCILGVNLSDGDLLEFLQQLADTDGSSAMPPSVLRVLNYKACRGAIMFGDSLLHSECSLLVEELKQTSLCFQCAHGRPTTVPLVNLEALHKQIAKLGVVDDDSSNSWHGLCRREITIDRAAKRLSAATS